MWEKMKQGALHRLQQAAEVDIVAKPLLDFINSRADYFTTSSCYGRIVLLDFRGKKAPERFVARWHRPVNLEEVKTALRNASGTIWLRAEPFILHISCRDLDAAKTVLAVKNDAGIKRGGIFHIGRRVQIELEGTARAEALVKWNRHSVDDEYLKKMIKICNARFEKNAADFSRMEKLFGCYLKTQQRGDVPEAG